MSRVARPTNAVYPPREDTQLLAGFADAPAGERVLEIGCGSGILAVRAARRGARVVATDLNPTALRLLGERARSEHLKVDVVRTDLARGLGRFDRILANPPYLRVRAGEEDPDRWHDLALNGGPDGCRTLSRLVAQLPEHLAPGGAAFVLISSVQDPARLAAILSRWTRGGGSGERVARRPLEGEVLEVWKLTRSAPRRSLTPAAPRSAALRRGTAPRRRSLRPSPPATSPAAVPERTYARDAASVRRRCLRGS